MNRLQTKDECVSRQELNSDPLVGGSVAAIQETLQRLENRGVIEVMEKPSPQGRPTKLYRAIRVRTCGGCVLTGQDPLNPVVDKEEKLDTNFELEGCPVSESSSTDDSKEKVDTYPDLKQCPVSKPSPGAPSEGNSTNTPYIGKRTDEEVNSALDQGVWDEPVQPMERIDAIEAMADFDNCIDVKAEDALN